MNSLLLVLLSGLARAASSPDALDADTVARMALDHDRLLHAADAEHESASVAVAGQEHRYGIGLAWSGAVSHDSAPYASNNDVQAKSTNTATGAVTLDRDFATGTDIALSVGSTHSLDGVTDGSNLAGVASGYTGTTVRLTVSQPLGAGAGVGVGRADLDVARARESGTEARWLATANQTVLEALSTWWELAYARRAVAVNEEALSTARQRRDDAVARIETGSLAPVEVASFDTTVASLSEALAQARAEERRLAIDLGRRIGVADVPNARDVSVPNAPAPRQDVESAALRRSPDVLANVADVEVARIQASVAGNGLLPGISAVGWVEAEDYSAPGVGTVVPDAYSGYVGFTGSFDLDRTRYRTEVARGAFAEHAAEDRLRSVQEQVIADVRTTLSDQAVAEERIALAETTLGLARRQYEAATDKYATGTGLAIEVVAAADAVRDAELRIYRARVDAMKASLRLAAMTGMLVTGS